MKHVLKPLPKIVLIPLGLTAAASVTDAANQNKVFGSSMTKLIIPNEKMDDIIKIIKSLEESGLLEKKVSAKQLKMKQKIRRVDFLECY